MRELEGSATVPAVLVSFDQLVPAHIMVYVVIYNISSLYSSHSWVYFNHAVGECILAVVVYIYVCVCVYCECNCLPKRLYTIDE